MYSASSECFSYDDPYQPKELPVEYLSGIEKLTCRMFNNNDSLFYSPLFSDQGEVHITEKTAMRSLRNEHREAKEKLVITFNLQNVINVTSCRNKFILLQKKINFV